MYNADVCAVVQLNSLPDDDTLLAIWAQARYGISFYDLENDPKSGLTWDVDRLGLGNVGRQGQTQAEKDLVYDSLHPVEW